LDHTITETTTTTTTTTITVSAQRCLLCLITSTHCKSSNITKAKL